MPWFEKISDIIKKSTKLILMLVGSITAIVIGVMLAVHQINIKKHELNIKNNKNLIFKDSLNIDTTDCNLNKPMGLERDKLY